jgi:hypothetical protein
MGTNHTTEDALTTPTPDPPPLWRVMHDAFLSSTLSGEEGHQGFAQEIRAVRDWIQCHSDLTMKPSTWHQIYDLLTAEADRAEQGDD